MKIEYEIEEDLVGIIDGEKYEIDDKKITLKNWHRLRDDFINEFSEFSSEEPNIDYELAYQDYGTNSLAVYIYNSKFYNKNFIPKILNILESRRINF